MAQYVLSLYILVVLTFKAHVTWLVYLQTNTIYKEIYKSISKSFVPAHTNGPHVSYATQVTHMQFPIYSHIHYHPL